MSRRLIDDILDEELENEERYIERKALSDPEIIAGEILHNKRLIPIMIKLSMKPASPRELLDIRIPTKKEIEEESRYGYKTKRTETVYEPIPKPTLYRLIKRLEAAGVIKKYKGIDKRKNYYKLTELGKHVVRELKKLLSEIVLRYSRPLSTLDSQTIDYIKRVLGERTDLRTQLIDGQTLNKLAEKLFIEDYRDLVEFLELKKVYEKKEYGETKEYYVVKQISQYSEFY